MEYNKLFDPEGLEDLRTESEVNEAGSGDRRDGKIYVYDALGEIVLAINVALATGRPLLIGGPSGSGKSSLAMHVARVLGRRYYEFVVTARAQAQDLTWRFDAVRRLADAQVAGRLVTTGEKYADLYPYIEPQALWWVYDSESAQRRGRPPKQEVAKSELLEDPANWDPRKLWEKETAGLPPEVAAKLTEAAQRSNVPQLSACVLLVDEIDKADPDVPNNLLVELGSRQFQVDLIDRTISFRAKDKNDWRQRPLIMITTNKERPLPQPFVRRCVVLNIPKPTGKLLRNIARRNLPSHTVEFFDLVLNAVLGRLPDPKAAPAADASQAQMANQAPVMPNALPPTPAVTEPAPPPVGDDEKVDVSIAEYVDTLRACAGLDSATDQVSRELLKEVVRRTVWSIKEKELGPQ